MYHKAIQVNAEVPEGGAPWAAGAKAAGSGGSRCPLAFPTVQVGYPAWRSMSRSAAAGLATGAEDPVTDISGIQPIASCDILFACQPPLPPEPASDSRLLREKVYDQLRADMIFVPAGAGHRHPRERTGAAFRREQVAGARRPDAPGARGPGDHAAAPGLPRGAGLGGGRAGHVPPARRAGARLHGAHRAPRERRATGAAGPLPQFRRAPPGTAASSPTTATSTMRWRGWRATRACATS